MPHQSEAIRVSLFKSSREPFLELLKTHGIEFVTHQPLIGVPMAADEWVEVLKSLSISAPLATVVVAFLKHRHSRKIIITAKDNTIIHAENLTHDELVHVLENVKSLTVIETGLKEN